MTVTPSGGYGHFFPTDRFATPVYFEGEGDAGAGGAAAPAGAAAPEAGAAAEGAAGAPVITPPEGAAPEGAEGAAAAATAAGAPVEPLPDPDDGTIPEALRPYVKQLRDEAAERRVTLKPYEDVFGKFEPEETQALLSVIGGLANEETQFEAATRLKAVVDSILGDGTEDPNRPLTRADLDRIEQTKQAKAQEEAAVTAVIKEATDLGYPEGTTAHRRLLDLAVNETGGDLKKAHEAIAAEREQIIADYAKQVMEGKAKWPTLAPPVGTTPANEGAPPKTWAEARANSQARNKAVYGS